LSEDEESDLESQFGDENDSDEEPLLDNELSDDGHHEKLLLLLFKSKYYVTNKSFEFIGRINGIGAKNLIQIPQHSLEKVG